MKTSKKPDSVTRDCGFLSEQLIVKLAELALSKISPDRLDLGKFRKRLFSELETVGILVNEPSIPMLYQRTQDLLGLSKEKINDLTETTEIFPVICYAVLEDWLKENSSLIVLHQGYYNFSGEERAPSFIIVNGLKIPDRMHILAKYAGEPVFLKVLCDKRAMNIGVSGESSPALIGELQQRVKGRVVKEFKGKTINHNLETVELKSYKREQLIYPSKLGKKIDDLLVVFNRWKQSDKVARWGYLFIGNPGTGKTTVGGLIHGNKGECTFMYCPAGEISSNDINQIFSMAKTLAPTILQIDDVDLIAKDRSDGDSSCTSALMENLDGLGEDSKIFVVLTTNDPAAIEDAIINRAGRVSGKIIFSDFGSCLAELLLKHAENYGLKVSEETTRKALEEQEKAIGDFTPDEAKNICERLYLLHGTETQLTSTHLIEAIDEVYSAFHDPDVLKRFTRNGKTKNAPKQPDVPEYI